MSETKEKILMLRNMLSVMPEPDGMTEAYQSLYLIAVEAVAGCEALASEAATIERLRRDPSVRIVRDEFRTGADRIYIQTPTVLVEVQFPLGHDAEMSDVQLSRGNGWYEPNDAVTRGPSGPSSGVHG